MASGRARLESLSRHDPQKIGGFVLLGRLGTGAMGRVYLGKSASGRLVAVKTIKGEYADEPDFRNRFAHEVAAARRVNGVYTAGVIDADADADIPWLATAYIPAPSLEQLVRVCGPLPVPALRWLAAGCAEALASIHQAGLVHRDMKPSNVLVSGDGPRVIDFGVARATERITFTATHQAVGTPAYMAPEQARDSRKTVAASDVFSLGSTLLFAATGHPPYTGAAVTDVMLKVANEPPDLEGLPKELQELVLACMEHEAVDRPRASDLLERLEPELEKTGAYGFNSAPLPDEALALIEDYRREMRPAAQSGSPSAADYTLDSPTASRDLDESVGPESSRRAAPDDDEAPTEDRKASDGTVARVIVISVVAVVVGIGLVLGGISLGKGLGDRQTPTNGYNNGPPPNGGGPPPQGPPGDDGQPGKPEILVNQPSGDVATSFVVHGSGYDEGARVTIRLDDKTAPVMPTADRHGTFNYTINQNHEFFPGGLPTGRHKVTVTVTGVGPKTVTFDVHN